MALLTCADCGRQVSDAAAACPGCGRPAAPGAQPARVAPAPASSAAAGPVGIVFVVGSGIFLAWCALRTPTRPTITGATTTQAPDPAAAAAPATANGEGPETLAPDDAAKDVATVLRANYPLSCKSVGAGNDWAKCHDVTKGFENVLRCAQAARAKAKAAASKPPGETARSTCGKTIASASRGVVVATAKMFDDLVPWLEKHRAQLAGPMANGSLQDACESITCDDEPSESLPAYADASYRHVMDVECTKSLFRCGPATDNVCWINKVADRLGLACDATENKTDSPLFVRATGTTIR